MKKLIYILTLACLLPLSSCAQKNNTASNNDNKLPEGVEIAQVPTVVVQDKLLDAIITPYKGKVVVVDFWATWCGPCMMAMKKIDPIKEQYRKDKKNVVFVYVTGETSPKNNWDVAIRNIKGIHYRLTDDQYKNLLGGLGIRGIPTYMIINKDGSVAYDNIAEGGYPGDDIIKGYVDKALEK